MIDRITVVPQPATEKFRTTDGKEFNKRPEAERHQRAIAWEAFVKGIMDAERFEAHPDHVAILKEMAWSWWHCEIGAPAVDCKRPYGNSGTDAVMKAIAKACNLEIFRDAEGDEHLTAEQERFCWQRHYEMKSFFEILSAYGEIPEGRYYREATYYRWRKEGHVGGMQAAIYQTGNAWSQPVYCLEGLRPKQLPASTDSQDALKSLWDFAFSVEID